MEKIEFIVPPEGQKITIHEGKLKVPDRPIIPFIEGDGTGVDIWRGARPVIDAAVQKAYNGKRRIEWMEVYAGEKSQNRYGSWLPAETVTAFREYLVGLKGPLTTPVGGGIRSLNVALRKDLDLYVCMRPVRWFQGVPAPVCRPDYVNMVIFRENTEDVYTGVEFPAGSEENQKLLTFFRQNFPQEYCKLRFTEECGIGIKPISKAGSQRLVRAAIRWALGNGRRSVTLVHKGNIMKYTEGAFRSWGYEVADIEFADKVYTWTQWEKTKAEKGEETANREQETALKSGRLLVKDVIADNAFMQIQTRPRELDVLATPNLNGDYLSDALAAQVGGLGIAPGANINWETGVAVFEATHGTAPKYAGKDMVNPGSVILSAELMLRYIGWGKAADLVIHGFEKAIAARTVTYDLARLMENVQPIKTSEFGAEIIKNMA